MKRGKSVKRILDLYDKLGLFMVISFEGNHRVLSYGNLDALAAFEYCYYQAIIGHSCMVFPNDFLTALESMEYDKAFFVAKMVRLMDQKKSESGKG